MMSVDQAAELLAEIVNVERMVPLTVGVAADGDTIYIYTKHKDTDIGFCEFYGYLVKTKYIGEITPA